MALTISKLCACVVVPLLLCACGSDDPPPPPTTSVAALLAAFKNGSTTCRAVVQQALDRIAAYNLKGPTLRAVLETNPDALALADQLDRQYRASGPVGPLHCVPLLVKDNFNTGDGMSTTAASLTMMGVAGGFKASADAVAIARLRSAGALPLAKTNMDEFAQGAAGYSSRGGQMPNVYKPGYSPGGSSGGSAIGVAAGFGMIATGTDTGGSIRIPSAYAGTVGIKPTLGLVARTGVIPSSEILDVAGPIARNVSDAALMLQAMAGPDAADPALYYPATAAPTLVPDYGKSLVASGLAGARLGVLQSFLGVNVSGDNSEFDAALQTALVTMQDQGATLRPGLAVPPESIGSVDQNFLNLVRTLALLNMRNEIGGYFTAYNNPTLPLHSFDDLVAASQTLGAQSRITEGLETAATSQYPTVTAATPTFPMTWDEAQTWRTRLQNAVLGMMNDANADAVVFLTMSCPAPAIPGGNATAYPCMGESAGGGAVLMASLTGFPEITVPAGYTRDGMPINVSFFGRPFSEAALIKLAYAYEQASMMRRDPALKP